MSKEEAIKELTEITDLVKEEIQNNDENTTAILDIIDLKSLDTVLGYVKELEQERELRIHYENRLDNMEQLYVDKDKIRDKIEELKYKREELSDNEGYWGSQSLLDQVDVLEELLESE